ncbi:MAG: hypothetical protein NZ928_01345 [Endomicrobia bacterium]|nr:hypothetical protein [Endomicrobiia bacterium]MCX7940733.1 hypothetical protein [Endomicrobiia bacterium]MDW8056547.1 hypothetical protein [Elusimicrobiota bacterium]
MKSLIVYYSRSGRTKLVAMKLAELLNSETEEIVDFKPRKGFLGWLISGYDALTKKITEIAPLTKNLDDYDHIILCSPVWALSIPPAIRTFLNLYKEEIKNISFIATMSSTGAKKMFKQLEELAGRKPKFVLAIDNKNLTTDKYIDNLKEIVENL